MKVVASAGAGGGRRGQRTSLRSEVSRRVLPCPKLLHPTLLWVRQGDGCPVGLPLCRTLVKALDQRPGVHMPGTWKRCVNRGFAGYEGLGTIKDGHREMIAWCTPPQWCVERLERTWLQLIRSASTAGWRTCPGCGGLSLGNGHHQTRREPTGGCARPTGQWCQRCAGLLLRC